MLVTLGIILRIFQWLDWFSRQAKPDMYFDNYPDLRRFRWLVEFRCSRLEVILDPGWPIRLPAFAGIKAADNC
jgi:hypothetical protein